MGEVPRKIAIGLFLLFCFFLPLFEAPKNIFSVLFLFLCGYIFFSSKKFIKTVSHNPQFYLLIFLSASVFMAGMSLDALSNIQNFRNSLNWMILPLIPVGLMVITPSNEELLIMVRIVIISCLFALGHSFVTWQGSYPELNSVGHVNHSALYVSYCIVMVGFLLSTTRFNLPNCLISIAMIVAGSYYLMISKSMVAFGGFFLSLTIVLILFVCRIRIFATKNMQIAAGFLLVITCLLVLGIFQFSTIFWDELVFRFLSTDDPFSKRDNLLYSSFLLAKDSVFGFGLGSYGDVVTYKNLQLAVESHGGSWSAEKHLYYSSSHGHNLFSTVLVERGWFGVLVIGFFLMAQGFILVKKVSLDFDKVALGLLCLSITFLCGIGQTTLHVEHGQLAFIILGFTASWLNNAEKSSKSPHLP